MIISCPTCQTRYQINPASLGAAGRTVRCSSCGNRWFVEPFTTAPTPAAEVPEPPEPASGPEPRPQPEPEPEAFVPRRPAERGSLLGWLTFTLVVLLLTAAVAGRNEIAAQFPTVLPVYQSLGLPVRLQLGLEFRELGSMRFEEGGKDVLVVSGAVENVGANERLVPRIRIGILDATRRELDVELIEPPQASLEQGATARFEARIEDLSPEARNFTVTFAQP